MLVDTRECEATLAGAKAVAEPAAINAVTRDKSFIVAVR
jgi:hypothetical protein